MSNKNIERTTAWFETLTPDQQERVRSVPHSIDKMTMIMSFENALPDDLPPELNGENEAATEEAESGEPDQPVTEPVSTDATLGKDEE